MASKICLDCGEKKDVTEFAPNPRMRFGAHSYCKTCMGVRSRRYYWKNREKVLGSHVLQRERNRTAEQRWKMDNPHRMQEYRAHMADRKRERDAEWRDKNKARLQESYRKSGLKKRGITTEMYDATLKFQGGVCAICKGVNGNGLRLSIDHDHSCEHAKDISCAECFRGLLCSHCNTSLHRMETMDGWHLKALAYLERYKEICDGRKRAE